MTMNRNQNTIHEELKHLKDLVGKLVSDKESATAVITSDVEEENVVPIQIPVHNAETFTALNDKLVDDTFFKKVVIGLYLSTFNV